MATRLCSSLLSCERTMMWWWPPLRHATEEEEELRADMVYTPTSTPTRKKKTSTSCNYVTCCYYYCYWNVDTPASHSPSSGRYMEDAFTMPTRMCFKARAQTEAPRNLLAPRTLLAPRSSFAPHSSRAPRETHTLLAPRTSLEARTLLAMFPPALQVATATTGGTTTGTCGPALLAPATTLGARRSDDKINCLKRVRYLIGCHCFDRLQIVFTHT